MTLTFNLLVTHDTDAIETDPDKELAGLVGEHFATPAAGSRSQAPLAVPNHLVVLLDHQYNERGLAADRLKGRDVEWRADCAWLQTASAV